MTTQSVTLQTAILMQVKSFAQNNQQFSLHDITREVRNKVNNGDLEIPEVEVSGASFRFDIPHVKVKALFEELYRTGVFDPDFTLSRQYTGVYYTYTPVAVQLASVPQQVSSPASVAATAVSTLSASTVASPDAEKVSVTFRIKKYLAGCKNRNFRPTLKQVQSAIKRGNESTGFSCGDLKEIITDDLGYTVVDNPDSVSAAQVAL